jgi:hypothetical protein
MTKWYKGPSRDNADAFPPADDEELGWEESEIVMAGISKKRKQNLYCNQLIPLCPPAPRPNSWPVANEIPPAQNAKFKGFDRL